MFRKFVDTDFNNTFNDKVAVECSQDRIFSGVFKFYFDFSSCISGGPHSVFTTDFMLYISLLCRQGFAALLG